MSAYHKRDLRTRNTAGELIDQQTLDALDSGSMIRELRSRGYETFPSLRVLRNGDTCTILPPSALGDPKGRPRKVVAA